MNEAKLGKLCEGTEPRDAVHVAIVPMVAGEKLKPGQHVGISKGNSGIAVASNHPVGVVDPFLMKNVNSGDTFWLCLYPGSITSLRHDWTHPMFAEPSAPEVPEATSRFALPNWRTPTAIAMVEKIVTGATGEDPEYEDLPILADVLEEAGCDDQKLVALCRKKYLSPILANRVRCLVLGGKYAESVKWLDEFCLEVGCRYENLIESADDWIENHEYHRINHQTPDIVWEKRRELWHHYEVVTGKEVEDKNVTFFSCAC